jgi:hypothetical protein
MRIAEDLVKDGATVSESFQKAITDIIAANGFTRIIETGTYHGTGTTRAVLEGLRRHGKPFEFYSIEVNPTNYRIAQGNLGTQRGLHLVNGLSIDRALLPQTVQFTDYPDDVIVDFKPAVREKSYLLECAFDVKDNCLLECLECLEYSPEVVILDSAGHIGTLEFEYLMAHVQDNFYLCLDDTLHVKHYKTAQKIRSDDRFRIAWETSDKFGSLIAKVQIR